MTTAQKKAMEAPRSHRGTPVWELARLYPTQGYWTAEAGISEYWIVDPENSVITVLALKGLRYEQTGKYKRGQKAASRLLAGFEINVTEALDAD